MSTAVTRSILLAVLSLIPLAAHADADDAPSRHNEATVAQLQAEMASGRLTSEHLTREYIARILALDQNRNGVNSVIELNPDAFPGHGASRGHATQTRPSARAVAWYPRAVQR